MTSIPSRLAANAVFGSLTEAHLDLVATCASTAGFDVDETVFSAGGEADAVHVLERGRVAMQLQPAAGDPLLIETVGPGDILGVSWMLPPYRWTVDAVAMSRTETIRLGSQCLRDVCAREPELGYSLHRAFAGLVRERLVSTRLQLLDVYAHNGG